LKQFYTRAYCITHHAHTVLLFQIQNPSLIGLIDFNAPRHCAFSMSFGLFDGYLYFGFLMVIYVCIHKGHHLIIVHSRWMIDVP
jgi:hypothetical protein